MAKMPPPLLKRVADLIQGGPKGKKGKKKKKE
jgi:hypothetical protein